MYWVYDLPMWMLAVLLVALCVGLTWLAILLARPHVRRWVGPQHDWNHVMGHLVASHWVIYGVLLALIAIGAFENRSDVERTVAREGSSVAALYRDVSSYPEPSRTELQSLLREYSRFTIEEAWPAMRKGIVLKEGTERVDSFQRKLMSFEPGTKGQELLHAEALRQFNIFIDARSQRLHAVTVGLPTVLWYIVAGGALLGFALTSLLIIDRPGPHLAATGILSAVTGLIIFLLVAMDHPFRGDVRISDEALLMVHRDLMTTTPGEGQQGH